MSDEEQVIENQSIEMKIYEFANELESKYLLEYNEKLENGEEEIDKTTVSKIQYYEKFVFKMKNSMEMNINGIYVVDSVNNGEHIIEIYKEEKDEETGITTRELMATVNEKGEVVFTADYATLQQSVSNKNIEEILENNEENRTAELEQETIDAIEMEMAAGNIEEGEIEQEEIKELEQESDSAEQVVAMAELQIMPGTVQELPTEEVNDSSDFKGHNRVAFGYSKKEHGYVFFDKDTGEKIVGPAVSSNKQVITQSNGNIEIERHSAMMASPSNPNQLYTIEIGAYGDRKLNKVNRTTEGNFVGRGMNIRGKDRETNNATIKAMNTVETRENMGETAEIFVEAGITNKKKAEWEMSGSELSEFMDEMRKQMGPGPYTEADLIDMYKKAATELEAEGIEPSFRAVVLRTKENWAKEQAENASENRTKADNEQGRALGDRPEDPRRAI